MEGRQSLHTRQSKFYRIFYKLYKVTVSMEYVFSKHCQWKAENRKMLNEGRYNFFQYNKFEAGCLKD